MHRSLILPALAGLIVLFGCGHPARPAATQDPKAQVATHPLDPLTWTELQTAVQILKGSGRFTDEMFLPILVLEEPAKKTVADYKPGRPLQRRAFAVVLDRKGNKTSEARIDLAAKKAEWKDVAGVQPNVLEEEFSSVPKIVRADAAWRAAIEKRGIQDFDKVLIDTWAAGVLPAKGAPPGARLCRAISFYRGDKKNGYGRPIEGLVAVVDVNQGKVVELVDTGVRPVAALAQDLDAASLGKPRPGLKPLAVAQPEGPSFELAGNLVRWQNWVFRYTMHPREGLVLHTVGYEDGGTLRPILHRASVSEMIVPYGDPDVSWVWRAAFDEGEYGLGRLANELEAGKDVPAHARLVDAVMAGEKGEPGVWKNAVAFYERDGGIAWKHYDDATEKSYGRRARQLVMEYHVTVGNYDYFIHWIFSQDGTIEVRAEASGILLAKGVPQDTCRACAFLADNKPVEGDERTGMLVAEKIVAPNHQHFFNFRLDFDVDGVENSVAELEVSGLPAGEGNPSGNAFMMSKKTLATEKGAIRDLDLQTLRHWKVYNPAVKSALGHHPAYMIVPAENSGTFLQPESSTLKRAGFVKHHLWVTAFKPEEMHAAGAYPNQNPGGDGLPTWTADDEPVAKTDVVLWYTVGLTHVPRPEEWPVMPSAGVGFKLVPAGFFTKNPALDLPGGD